MPLYGTGPVTFVDEFSAEFSRDIEPMKGGHGDNYVYAGSYQFSGDELKSFDSWCRQSRLECNSLTLDVPQIAQRFTQPVDLYLASWILIQDANTFDAGRLLCADAQRCA
jgi:hypothetical protein